MLKDTPCLKWLYSIPDADTRYNFFLDMVTAMGIDTGAAHEMFFSIPHAHSLFGEYYDESSFQLKSPKGSSTCEQIIKTYMGYIKSYKPGICKTCKYSIAYTNYQVEEEAILLSYVLRYPSLEFIIGNNITPSLFRYTLAIIPPNNKASVLIVNPLAKVFNHICKYLRKNAPYSYASHPIQNILENMRLTQNLLSSLYNRGAESTKESIYEDVAQILIACEKKYPSIRKNDALEALKKLKSDSSYVPPKRNSSMQEIPLFSFLGVPSDKTVTVPINNKKGLSKTEQLLSIDEVQKRLPTELNQEKSSLAEDYIYMNEMAALNNEGNENLEGYTTGNPYYFLEVPLASEDGITSEPESTKKIADMSCKGNPNINHSCDTSAPVTELLQMTNTQVEDVLFMEDGYVDVSDSINAFQMQSIHKDDLLHFFKHLYKSDWIAVEAARYRDVKGLCVYGGNNRVSGFLEESLIDEGTLDLLFNTSSFEVITQNMPLIASYLIRAGKNVDIGICSLTAMHKALTDSNVLYPYKKLNTVCENLVPEATYTRLISHLSQYMEFADALSRKLEMCKKHKTYVNYYYYEYMLGTSYHIDDVIKMKFQNLTRKDFQKNTFGYMNIFDTYQKGVVMKISYITNDATSFDNGKHYTLLTYILAYIIKNTTFRVHPMRLLSAEIGIIYLFIPTRCKEYLNLLEEYIGISITKRCRDFNMTSPSIEIKYIK